MIATVPSSTAEAPEKPPRTLAVALAVGVALVAAAAWLAYLAALGWHAFSSHSDSANAVLAGRDMVTGNLFLAGWNLPQASYWTMDLPLYGLLSLFVGADATVVHLGPAIIGAGLVVVAAVAARADSVGARSWAGAAVVVVLLGLPHPFLTYILYQGPWHVGTPLFCLGGLLLLRRADRRGWAAGVALVALAVIGDALALAIGIVPLVGGAAFEALRARSLRPAVRPVVAAGMAAAGALVVRVALDRLGGFTSVSQPLRPRNDWAATVRTVPDLLLRLLGAGDESGLSGGYRAVHFVGAALVVVALAATALVLLYRLFADRPVRPSPGGFDLDMALWLGFLGGIATMVAVTPPGSGIAGARYLPGPLAYAAVLAGRRLNDGLARVRWAAARVALPVGGLVALGYLTASLSGLSSPTASEPEAELAAWLKAQGLVSGYGDYWTASDLTLNSAGDVVVRPVIPTDGKLHGQWYYAKRSWFTRPPTTGEPTFVVFDRERRHFGVSPEVITATFGPPAGIRQFGAYDIVVYGHDLRPALGPPVRP